MTQTIDPKKKEIYLETARAREAKRWADGEKRREMAWEAARRAAKLLKTDFGASRVLIFGSLAHGSWFGPRSDIDLAVEGISPGNFWRSWCSLDVLGRDFEINLVAMEPLSGSISREIWKEGIEL